MNNRGLTLVELIVTFALAAVIIILLLNVLLIIKKNFEETDVKTKLVVEQSTLSNLLNSKFVDGNLVSGDSCTSFPCTFVFKDGTSFVLEVTSKRISFDKYVYNLDKNSNVVNPTIEYTEPFLTIRIPIKNNLYPGEDFGINLVYRKV